MRMPTGHRIAAISLTALSIAGMVCGCGRTEQFGAENLHTPANPPLHSNAPSNTSIQVTPSQPVMSEHGSLSAQQAQPIAVPVRSEAQPLPEQLKTAKENLAEAETRLNDVRERRLEALSEDKEYRDAKQTTDELEEKVKSMRAAKSARLADTSKEWIAAKSKLAKLLHLRDEALLQDSEYTLASSEIAKLKTIITKLQDAIREEAARIARDKQRKEQAERIVQSPDVSSGSSGSGTVYVKGYYRKDGTYVRGYTRRK